MSKEQNRGNREAKKPKANKKPATAAASPFTAPQAALPHKGARKPS
ncbi:hypothetical protein [Lichenicola sp.]